jgi:tetratricopeptide (TPR) repeat protein
VYRNASEGTAFLVDEQGHLLTSRHVACPWLEDGLLLQTAKQLLDQKRVPWLGHRIHLWFEGQKAFNRMGHFLDTPDVSDFFFTENAYGTDSPARLTVAGVALPPVHTRQLIASPLGDDIAVLRVDDPPDGLVPLPLDRSAAPHRIPRLSHVIALGFPLGSRTQEDTVNASAVDGHVRRSFANMLQIDSSLHGGNSGGPIIDARGKVIGIVAAVAVERSGGLFSTTRPLGDIGLILPITGAARLLAEVKAGGIKWNGVIDFTLDAKLRVVKEQALLGKWATARALAEGELERNPQAELLVACGVLALGNDDLEDARLRFEQLRSMDPRDGRARFLLYLVDWLSGDAEASPYRRELLEADWRSPLEFPGHLVRVLEGEIPIDPGLRAWQTRRERSWLHYVGGLLHHRAGRTTEAQTAFREAVLAGDFAGWGPQLARAGLEKLFRERRDRLRTPDEWSAYRDDLAAFREARDAALAALKAREEQLAPVLAELLEGRLDLRARLERLEKIRELDPEVPKASATLGFLHAADENWPRALECIREFLGREGRPTASRMTLGLIEAGILHHQGREDEAERVLESYGDTVRDGSYLGIAEHLLGRIDEETVTAEAAERPQDLLIAHTVLGFWAEGAGREAAAVTHYKEALGSFLDDWPEYDFARERIGRIRQATNDRD